jgi:ribosomal protein S18 acetylase RimI-like enzyme
MSYPFELIPAKAFSYEELTEAYNTTRVDYIVPMPMNANKLREYVETYDVDMEASAVAVDGNEVLGLGMLGVRKNRAWITRLGVIRNNRRNGTGEGLVDHLIDQAQQRDQVSIILEVIEDNTPAYSLFTKKGFKDTRDLLVLRRPPNDVIPPHPEAQFQTLGYKDALELLQRRCSIPSWLDEYQSLVNAGNLSALCVTLPDNSQGWLVYQNTIFQLARLVIQTEVGDPLKVGRALLVNSIPSTPFKTPKPRIFLSMTRIGQPSKKWVIWSVFAAMK